MGSVLLILFIAVANLALGAGLAIALKKAPPLREIIDGIIYEPFDGVGNSDEPTEAPG